MKGWLSVPGIREHADRTLAEQMLGLDKAVAECKGKRVLDLGCAEGLIGLEFAKAGAVNVVGIESLQTTLT
jgi:2-polyprenyl-3-methyl-5-hydroxy-6-metoxy-1,4-benzoquinol methylase